MPVDPEKPFNLSLRSDKSALERPSVVPNLILADEPTGNLDSTTSKDIMKVFVDLNAQGQTIVIVTHENDIAEYAERQVHLLDGLIDKDFLNDKGGV